MGLAAKHRHLWTPKLPILYTLACRLQTLTPKLLIHAMDSWIIKCSICTRRAMIYSPILGMVPQTLPK